MTIRWRVPEFVLLDEGSLVKSVHSTRCAAPLQDTPSARLRIGAKVAAAGALLLSTCARCVGKPELLSPFAGSCCQRAAA